jgi:hypothetical protein
MYLFQEQLSELFLVQVVLLKLNLDLFVRVYLLFSLAYFFEEGVCESFVNSDPEVGVEDQYPREEVNGILSSSWVEGI